MNRQDFSMLKKKIEGYPLIYLDTAATALKPQSVIDAIQEFYTYSYGTVHRAVYSLAREATDAYNLARSKVQTFLGASYPEEIIFTRGTTASLNLLARSFGKCFLQPGDSILISEIEHHSNIVPWQMLCEERGAVLKIIPVTNTGELDLAKFYSLLDGKVKLVSIAHLSNITGTLHPVKEVIEGAHQVGAYVCLDGAQSAPHLPINVQALDVDFYACSGHKLYGPTGIGILYGKKALLEKMPPVEGGGDMIEKVTFEKTTYNVLPMKFEAGTPMIAEAIGLGAAIDYLSSIGMEKIWSWEKELTEYATERLREVQDLRVIGTAKEKGAIITFVIDKIHPMDLATLLDCRGVAMRTGHHCSQPAMERFGVSSAARVSFGLYNTREEIDQFMEALQGVLKHLR